MAVNQLFCNGRPADTASLAAALVNYGHFTSMQVRDHAVQGLGLHLNRLAEATQRLFGVRLDAAQVRRWMAEALAQAGVADASLRVTVFSPAFDFRAPLEPVPVDVLVAVSPPVTLTAARSVRTVRYQRDMPDVKHVGTFGLFAQRRAAMAAGFDDALFIAPKGRVSEGTTWNLAVRYERRLTWPDADVLHGITEALVQMSWLGPQDMQPLTLRQLDEVEAAFACNANGVWALSAIDGRPLPRSEALAEEGREALAKARWEPLG